MAAVYYTSSPKSDVFIQHAISVPIKIGFLETIRDKKNITVITEISVQTNEVIQFFPTFDDVVKFFHFGKGLGNISIAGVIFVDIHGAMPGVDTLLSSINAVRGKAVAISIGNYWFKGVVMNANIGLVAEPVTMANFSVNIAMTDSSFSKLTEPPTCS